MPRHAGTFQVKRIVCGDALLLIPTLPDRSVNLCLTSPPYAEKRKRQYGGVPEADYPAWMVAVMAALRPKLTGDGSVLIVIRSHVRDGVVSDYVLKTRLALRNDGWKECEELIWLKPNAPPLGSDYRPRRTWEHILWFSKTPKPYIDLRANGSYSDSIGFGGSNKMTTMPPRDFKDGQSRTPDHFTALMSENENGIHHPAMFPATLCEKLILTFSKEGQRVADIFCGSGQTLVAAKRLGRRWIGFDSKREYVELAAKRLNTPFSEHVVTINPGQPVRLRTDFPDTAKSRRIYLKSRNLNASDAAVFEFVLSKTVSSNGRTAAAELSHNQIATATGISRSTVIRSIKRLADLKLIETLKDAEWHRGRSNRVGIAASLLVPIQVWASVTTTG
jgi:DNA modification methylase